MAALADCRPGDVLVVATGGHVGAAVTGDLLIGVARNRGAAGFVTDGLVRDLDDLETIGLPIYALGVTPNSPQRRGPGSVGLPIVCGGVSIASGDVVVGDRDGVVVIPRARICGDAGGSGARQISRSRDASTGARRIERPAR